MFRSLVSGYKEGEETCWRAGACENHHHHFSLMANLAGAALLEIISVVAATEVISGADNSKKGIWLFTFQHQYEKKSLFKHTAGVEVHFLSSF